MLNCPVYNWGREWDRTHGIQQRFALEPLLKKPSLNAVKLYLKKTKEIKKIMVKFAVLGWDLRFRLITRKLCKINYAERKKWSSKRPYSAWAFTFSSRACLLSGPIFQFLNHFSSTSIRVNFFRFLTLPPNHRWT